MAPRSHMSYLSEASQQELKDRLLFVQQNRKQVSGLVANTAKLSGFSRGMVSLVLNGQQSNPVIIRTAHRLVARTLGLPDPSEIDGLISAEGSVDPKVAKLQGAFHNLQEKHGAFQRTTKEIGRLNAELEHHRSDYAESVHEVKKLLEVPEGTYPDAFETMVRETMALMTPLDTNPRKAPTLRSFEEQVGQRDGESDVDYAIRMMRADGLLNPDGTPAMRQQLPEELVPGRHVDEETGQEYFIPKD